MKKYKMELESLEQARAALCSSPEVSCCMDCPLHKAICKLHLKSCNTFIKDFPDEAAELMGLEVVEIKEETKLAKETNAPCKTDKPRLAEILGVDVGEKFRIQENGGFVTFEVTDDGHFKTDPPNQVGSTYLLLDAINRPDIIIRQPPHLTSKELAICKAVFEATGAKWLCRHTGYLSFVVQIWAVKPHLEDLSYHSSESGTIIASFDRKAFPSLSPGDCVNVEELLKEVSQ